MFKKLKSLPVGLLALVLLLSGCDTLFSQKLADVFWGGKIPKQLEWIRSQLREIPLKAQEKIIARVEEDKSRTDLLHVAVIDSGVDIAQPDLLSQLDFRTENGRLVGAGVDIMGGGPSGSHVLVDPTLFAFGAKGLKQGQIVEAPESPLKELETVNNRFRDLMMAGIQQDPVLNKSLFANLKRDTFTVFGFEKIKNKPLQSKSEYDRNKNEGELITPQNLDSKIKADFSAAGAKFGWDWMDEKEHRPEALLNATSYEGGDVFIKLVLESYKTVDRELNFSKNLTNFNRFFSVASGEKLDPAKLNDFPDTLKQAMVFVLKGPDMYDPIVTLENTFKSSLDYKDLPFDQAFEKYYATTLNQIEKSLANKKIQGKERIAVKKAKADIGLFHALVENIIALKNDPVAYTKMRSDIRRLVYRSKHPYISPKTLENEHATHVSGIIAKQDPNIRILPVRVTTQTVAISKERSEAVVEDLLKRYDSFAQSAYFEPLKNKIAAEYGKFKIADSTLRHLIKNYLQKNTLNAIFIQDVIKAVEVAGQNKVKLANVSLGMAFDKNISLSQRKASYAEDLFSEFSRYEIGAAMLEKAPGTLFLIATGNENAWVDGVSRTAFPVGITSQRLIKVAKENNLEPSPNNRTKNVLAVGSINGDSGNMSSFSNLLIDPNIPQIFSTGEEIMSTVPGKDPGKVSSPAFMKISKALRAPMVAGLEPLPEDAAMEDSDVMYREMENDLFSLRFNSTLRDSMSTMMHVMAPLDHMRMSGTSMATPTATGVIAHYLVQKMKAEKITTEQSYLDPRMMPEQIIADVMRFAKSNQLSSFLTIKMLVDGIEKWTPSKAEKTQMQFANRMLKSPKAAVAAPTCDGVLKAQ